MTHVRFAVLIGCVIAAAGVTIALATLTGVPLVALGFAALVGTLLTSYRGRRR